jgi:hypothetical protein
MRAHPHEALPGILALITRPPCRLAPEQIIRTRRAHTSLSSEQEFLIGKEHSTASPDTGHAQ